MSQQEERETVPGFWKWPDYTTTPIDTQIKADHAYIRDIFQQYKTATNPQMKLQFINEFIRTVSVHSVAEEIVVYPALEERLVRGREIRAQSLKEHAFLKKLLHAVDRMSMQEPSFDHLMETCMTELERHMQDEETDLLVQLRRNCWETELVALCNDYNHMKARVPTHPHPMAPDRPPWTTLMSMLQAPIDKMYDYMTRIFPQSAK